MGQILAVFGAGGQTVQKLSTFTAKCTSLPKSASFKPFCVAISWGVWPPGVLLNKKRRKSQNLPLKWCVAVNTGLHSRAPVMLLKLNVEPCFAEIVDLKPRDCSDIYKSGEHSDGVYTVYTGNRSLPIQVYCDMSTDGGGWTVCFRTF